MAGAEQREAPATSLLLTNPSWLGLSSKKRATPRKLGWCNWKMGSRTFFDVDPGMLHLPLERIDGADPTKLQRQIARHGKSLGMPPVLVYRGSDGELMLSDGVTRATRAAKLCPASVIPAELLGTLPHPVSHLPTVKEKLP